MPRILLDNEQWDFGTNCFVCEPKNKRGIGIPFYHDTGAGRVVTEFTPQPHHSGAPSYAHGGLNMALLDEGMNWAIIVLAQRFGLMQKAETAFRRPVKVGEPHTIACWVEEGPSGEGERTGIGEIRNAEGKVCVRMTASYYVMTKEQAEAAIGPPSEQAGSFTRS